MSDNVHVVKAPLMGTFYRASGPGQEPFVSPGDRVGPGDVVCIIESMKIFTEIRTDRAGTVRAVLLENEDLAMKNQALIEIEPEESSG